eukprot:CAMPEP_0182824698 /NCGR_PEP_ID=MMETSP0006_2-20121128/15431_1 /TAXON_ID=97485 /ORGANISM="Prymnesium parvum, Strain Texoma1" /LENGTH=46 /DNA_ID= /DNA_START= /DNA_END= /DNA_ORIENTATION=
MAESSASSPLRPPMAVRAKEKTITNHKKQMSSRDSSAYWTLKVIHW